MVPISHTTTAAVCRQTKYFTDGNQTNKDEIIHEIIRSSPAHDGNDNRAFRSGIAKKGFCVLIHVGTRSLGARGIVRLFHVAEATCWLWQCGTCRVGEQRVIGKDRKHAYQHSSLLACLVCFLLHSQDIKTHKQWCIWYTSVEAGGVLFVCFM